MKVKQKKKKPTNKHKESLKEIWREIKSDKDCIKYIINNFCELTEETKIDMLFSLHNCLHDRSRDLAAQIWKQK